MKTEETKSREWKSTWTWSAERRLWKTSLLPADFIQPEPANKFAHNSWRHQLGRGGCCSIRKRNRKSTPGQAESKRYCGADRGFLQGIQRLGGWVWISSAGTPKSHTKLIIQPHWDWQRIWSQGGDCHELCLFSYAKTRDHLLNLIFLYPVE